MPSVENICIPTVSNFRWEKGNRATISGWHGWTKAYSYTLSAVDLG